MITREEEEDDDDDNMAEDSSAYDEGDQTPNEDRYADEGDEWLPDSDAKSSSEDPSSDEGEGKEVPIGAESPLIAREPHTSDDSDISEAEEYERDALILDAEEEEKKKASPVIINEEDPEPYVEPPLSQRVVIEGDPQPVEDISEDQTLQLEILKRLPVSKTDYAELIELAAKEYRISHPKN